MSLRDQRGNRLMTHSPNEALAVSVAALKSVVSDYALRCRQAEEMCNVLMSEKIPKEVFLDTVVNKLKQHIEARGLERSTQLLGIIQTTMLSLTSLQRNHSQLEPEELDKQLIEIIKALTIAANPS